MLRVVCVLCTLSCHKLISINAGQNYTNTIVSGSNDPLSLQPLPIKSSIPLTVQVMIDNVNLRKRVIIRCVHA